MKQALRYHVFNERPFESHAIVYNLIRGQTNILDIGSATGYVGEHLKKKGCHVWGIEIDPQAAKVSRSHLEKVYIGDVKEIQKMPIREHFFDYILMQDVLEHIRDSKGVLRSLQKYLKKGGAIIISTPNIAHVSIRLRLLCGKFVYEETGIMDKTHVHFFTQKTLYQYVKSEGYTIEAMDFSADFGQLIKVGKFLRRIPKVWQHFLTTQFPQLLAVQFIAVCKKR